MKVSLNNAEAIPFTHGIYSLSKQNKKSNIISFLKRKKEKRILSFCSMLT